MVHAYSHRRRTSLHHPPFQPHGMLARDVARPTPHPPPQAPALSGGPLCVDRHTVHAESRPLVSRSTAHSIVPSHCPYRPTPRSPCCQPACRTAVVHLQKRSACACCWCCHEMPPMYSVPSACNRIKSSAVAAVTFVCIRNTSVARSERKGGNSDPKLSVALRCQNSTQTQP